MGTEGLPSGRISKDLACNPKTKAFTETKTGMVGTYKSSKNLSRKEVYMNNLLRSVVLVVLGLYLSSCEFYLGTGCVGCHTDEELLKEIADPIQYPEGSGEG